MLRKRKTIDIWD